MGIGPFALSDLPQRPGCCRDPGPASSQRGRQSRIPVGLGQSGRSRDLILLLSSRSSRSEEGRVG